MLPRRRLSSHWSQMYRLMQGARVYTGKIGLAWKEMSLQDSAGLGSVHGQVPLVTLSSLAALTSSAC